MPVHSIWTNTCSHCCCFLVSVNPSSLVALTFFCDHTDMIWIKMEDPGYHVKVAVLAKLGSSKKWRYPKSPKGFHEHLDINWWLGLSMTFLRNPNKFLAKPGFVFLLGTLHLRVALALGAGTGATSGKSPKRLSTRGYSFLENGPINVWWFT